jgi:hypothetical protein
MKETSDFLKKLKSLTSRDILDNLDKSVDEIYSLKNKQNEKENEK